MKSDAVIRVPRAAHEAIRDFAWDVKRDVREVAGEALVEYVRKKTRARLRAEAEN